MAFDPNVIPPDQRSKQHIAAHVEIYRRTQDTWEIHNPTDEDFIVYNDRKFSNESWTVPNKNKDVGMGKGNLHVPAFVGLRYINKMGEKMIIKTSEEDWAKKKLQYRQDEWGEKEERMAIRLNNKEEWDKITPVLFHGVVKRYQEDNAYQEQDAPEPKKPVFSQAEAALERLGISEKEVGLSSEVNDIEDKKRNLANQLT